MAAAEVWCEVTMVRARDTQPLNFQLEGAGPPDLETVDRLARLALSVKRRGGGMVLSGISPALREVLELAGLRVEMEGKSEGGEESLGVHEVQEEVHGRDLAF
jgi:hypothetical protein